MVTTFPEKTRARREALNLPKSELARLAGLDRRTIIRAEQGERVQRWTALAIDGALKLKEGERVA
jgi:DNA-binding XRE family transcriptional regulator